MQDSYLLSAEQRTQFDSEGYLLISGLIPGPAVAAARSALGKIAREKAGQSFFSTTAANECYTPALCGVAETLGGPTSRPYYPVSGALAIITYPGAGEWVMPDPHIDHALASDSHRVFPQPYRLASLLYLNDVAPHGGGTVVWPGSHRQIEQLARSDLQRYALMATLNEDLAAAGLDAPRELTPKAGDILFYHYLLAHAGSRNTTNEPRIALNHKW